MKTPGESDVHSHPTPWGESVARLHQLMADYTIESLTITLALDGNSALIETREDLDSTMSVAASGTSEHSLADAWRLFITDLRCQYEAGDDSDDQATWE